MRYNVHMWFTASPALDNDTIAEFSKRWTSTLQAGWASKPFDAADLGDLASQLNNEIWTKCRQAIANDVAAGDPSKVVSVNAFTAPGWTDGGGGLHSGISAIQSVENEINKPYWTFTVTTPASTKTITMCACASFMA